jgi:AraC-like DNA-binding protein
MTDYSLRFYVPQEKLRTLVSSYYIAEFPPVVPVTDQMIPEWGNIRLITHGVWQAELPANKPADVPQAVLVGFTSRAFTISSSSGSKIVGIGLLPAGWAQIIGQDANEYVDSMSPLSVAFGDGAQALFDRVCSCQTDSDITKTLDDFLLSIIASRPAPPDIITTVMTLLTDDTLVSVDLLAEKLGLSSRQVGRLCLKYFGFPPKLLLRRQRFLRNFSQLRQLKMGTWADHIDMSYVDQSHFIREFRYFMRASPSRYFGSTRHIITKSTEVREKILGAPVQALHKNVAPRP